MKNIIKLVLPAILLLCGIQNSSAQDDDDWERYERRIHFGPKAGVNYSNVFDERGDEFVASGKFGFVGGAFVSLPIGLHFAIQPEILFSQKGFKATGSIIGFDYELTRTSNFIDIPVYFAWRPLPFISLLAGPQFSYLVRQKDVFSSSDNSFLVEQEFDNENIRKNLLGFIAGVDVNIHYVVVGMRAGFDFQQNQGDGTSSAPRYKNVWLQGTAAFRF